MKKLALETWMQTFKKRKGPGNDMSDARAGHKRSTEDKDRKALDVVNNSFGVTSTDLAFFMGIKSRAAQHRLRRLHNNGLIKKGESKRGRATIYYPHAKDPMELAK